VINKILVVGVGNSWRGDDGIGPKIVGWLKENVEGNDYLIESDLFSLLDIFEKYQHIVIIDAVNMGEQPGVVKSFTPAEVKLGIKTSASSTHGFGLADIIKLAESLQLKTSLQIIGIQVGDVAFGNALSSQLQNSWEHIVERVQQEVKHAAMLTKIKESP